MRRTDKSMKAVVNDALRRGLGARGKPPRPPRFKVEPHAFAFRTGVDTDRLNQLVDELEAAGTGGNLTTDAHLAALAIEHQAEIHSTDADMARFPGLRWVNPLL